MNFLSNQKNDERFEFLLYIQGHIVVQRSFHILGYNEDVLDSMELKEVYDDCVKMVKNHFEGLSREFLYSRYNQYVPQKEEDINHQGIDEKPGTFTFEIRVDNTPVITGDFDGSVYTPSSRYMIDIKSITSDMIYYIRKAFTKRRYTTKYMDYDLMVQYTNLEELGSQYKK